MDDLHKMLTTISAGRERKAGPGQPLDVFREFIARLEELQRRPARPSRAAPPSRPTPARKRPRPK